MTSDYRRSLSQLRSQELARNLQGRLDLRVQEVVALLAGKVSFDLPRESYLISRAAWDHVAALDVNPALVFCHADMLVEEPFVSLYYRGISGLSLKEVQNQARSVVARERDPEKRTRKSRVNSDEARQVAGLYNSVMSSIIENTTDWVLENCYRTMIASLGISFDGTMRNKVGRLPEQRVRKLLLQYVVDQSLLAGSEYPDVDALSTVEGVWELTGSVRMAFGSEPDVAFRKSELLEATIEIKGGIDPAGALERLGAANKSATAALDENPRCKNFLVAGAITEEMRNRLDQSRLFERYFSLVDLLASDANQADFFNEIFHHALRVTAS